MPGGGDRDRNLSAIAWEGLEGLIALGMALGCVGAGCQLPGWGGGGSAGACWQLLCLHIPAHDLLTKNGHSLIKHLGDAEEGGSGQPSKLKEKATLYKITANAMMEVGEAVGMVDVGGAVGRGAILCNWC